MIGSTVPYVELEDRSKKELCAIIRKIERICLREFKIKQELKETVLRLRQGSAKQSH